MTSRPSPTPIEADSTRLRPAVFLDRDDTLIANVPYLTDPALLRVLPGAAEAVAALNRAGFAVVLTTNQSAVGRGLLSEERLREIHDELIRLLAERGAVLDAIHHSPHVPRGGDRAVVEFHDRKPGPGMLLRAASELGLDLASSWMVGDLISDVLAGINAGCRSILVGSNATLDELPHPVEPDRALAVADLAAAAALILEQHDPSPGGAAPC